MWVEKLPDGKFKFRERYKDPLTSRWKKVSITMDKDNAGTRKKASSELARQIDEALNAYKQKEYTLEDLYNAYILYQSKAVKMSTFERNKRTLRKLVNLLGKNAIVDNLTTQYINKTLLSLEQNPGTLNEYLKRFKAMLNWGYTNDYVNNRLIIEKLGYFPDVPHPIKIKDKYLEPDEIEKLLKKMGDSLSKNNMRWCYLTKFMLLSGLRAGEAIALELGDIDETEGVIHVTKTYDHVNKIVTTTKTTTSTRDVYIQSELSTLISQIKHWQKKYCMEKGFRSKLLFPGHNGNYINYYSFEKYLKENAVAAIGRPISSHCLRHTHASLLFADRISIDTISRRLGHENSKVTREIYLHVTKKLIEYDNAQLKDLKIL